MLDRLKNVLLSLTPPVVHSAYQKIRDRLVPAELFDGESEVFRSAFEGVTHYGEYGCGQSTRWVLEHTSAAISAVESDPRWLDSVREHPDAPGRLRARAVDLGPVGDWGRPLGYSHRHNFADYTDWIWTQSTSPETVLVDGRFRVACFLTSLKHAAPGTRIVIDDYQQLRYKIIEEFAAPQTFSSGGRQALFVVPDRGDLDLAGIDHHIGLFRYVMD